MGLVVFNDVIKHLENARDVVASVPRFCVDHRDVMRDMLFIVNTL